MKIGTSDVIRWLQRARSIIFLQLCSFWYLPSSPGLVKCPASTFLLRPKLSLEIYGKKWSRKIKVAQMLVFIRLNPIPPPSLPVKLLSKLTPGLLYFKLCCIYSFEVSHSMQQFGITGFFAFPAGSCTARPKINFFSNPYQPHTPVHLKKSKLSGNNICLHFFCKWLEVLC